MAKAKKKAHTPARRAVNGRPRPAAPDAIALLKAEHREVQAWFEQFESTRSHSRKEDLTQKICRALKVHAQIEEEIFYPAFLAATREEDIHHQAEVEHEAARRMIAEIEAAGINDSYHHARMIVLCRTIKLHVAEEERRDGIFAKARRCGVDLATLGEQLAIRKSRLITQQNFGTHSRNTEFVEVGELKEI